MPLIDLGARETRRIDLPTPGEWVEVKAVLTHGEEVEVQRRLVAGVQVRPGEELQSIDAGSIIEGREFGLLEVALVAWSFEAPLTPDNLRRLDSPSVRHIQRELEALYGSRTPEAARNLGGSGAMPSSAGAASQPTLSGSP